MPLYYVRHDGRPSPAMRNFIVSEPSTPGMDVKFTLAPNITRAAVAVARNNAQAAARADAEAFATAALSSIPAHVQGSFFTSMNRAGLSSARQHEILANAGRNSSFEVETSNLTSSDDEEPPVSRKRKLVECKSESGREVKFQQRQPKKPKYDLYPVYETSVIFPNEHRPKTFGKDWYEEVDAEHLCSLPVGTEFWTTSEYMNKETGETMRRGYLGTFVSKKVLDGETVVRYTSRKPSWLRVPVNGIPWSPRIYRAFSTNRFYLKREANWYRVMRELESSPIGVEDGIIGIIRQFM